MSRHLILGGCLGALLLAVVAVAQQPPGGNPGAFPGGFFPGPFTPSQPGQILPAFMQEQLHLTKEQKKQLAELQKEVDARLAKILTEEQKKQMKEPRRGGFGPGIPGGPGAGQGGFGPPGGFGVNPQNRLDDAKKQLGASDEEWKVIGPKIQKVISARRILTADAPTANPFGPQFGPPGFDSPGTNIITQAQAELQAVLKDPKHTKKEVEEKVAAVRKARQKARAELEAAHKDLLQMVTSSQEAVLVGLGYLE